LDIVRISSILRPVEDSKIIKKWTTLNLFLNKIIVFFKKILVDGVNNLLIFNLTKNNALFFKYNQFILNLVLQIDIHTNG